MYLGWMEWAFLLSGEHPVPQHTHEFLVYKLDIICKLDNIYLVDIFILGH